LGILIIDNYDVGQEEEEEEVAALVIAIELN
jgi:hypothetical protein